MSNLPPPGSYGSPPPPPPWQNQPQAGGLTAQTPPKKSNTPKIVIGVIVAAVLAVVGVVVATRGDDDTKSIASSTDASVPETEESDPGSSEATVVTEPTTESPTTTSSQPSLNTLALPTITTSLPNASVVPATAPPATAAAPTTTVPFVLPAGAIDLGYQVYIPVPEGFTDTKSDSGLDTISNADGSTKVSVQVLSRTVGEDPAALMQEYADSWSDEFDATNFTSTVRYTLSGTVPAYEYGSYYETYDTEDPDGVSVSGGLYIFQRADGLSAVYDVFGPVATMGLPRAAFDGFLSSFSAAPLLGPTGDLQTFPSFRPTTTSSFAVVSNLLGFTPAPDFAAATDPNGGTRVRSADEDFTVDLLQAQASSDAAVQTAQGLLAAEYTDITFEPLVSFDAYHGLTHVGIPWIGTYTDGYEVTGAIDLYWDPDTTNAIAIIRAWYTTDDGQEPAKPQTLFMNAAITDDIAYGIPNP